MRLLLIRVNQLLLSRPGARSIDLMQDANDFIENHAVVFPTASGPIWNVAGGKKFLSNLLEREALEPRASVRLFMKRLSTYACSQSHEDGLLELIQLVMTRKAATQTDAENKLSEIKRVSEGECSSDDVRRLLDFACVSQTMPSRLLYSHNKSRYPRGAISKQERVTSLDIPWSAMSELLRQRSLGNTNVSTLLRGRIGIDTTRLKRVAFVSPATTLGSSHTASRAPSGNAQGVVARLASRRRGLGSELIWLRLLAGIVLDNSCEAEVFTMYPEVYDQSSERVRIHGMNPHVMSRVLSCPFSEWSDGIESILHREHSALSAGQSQPWDLVIYLGHGTRVPHFETHHLIAPTIEPNSNCCLMSNGSEYFFLSYIDAHSGRPYNVYREVDALLELLSVRVPVTVESLLARSASALHLRWESARNACCGRREESSHRLIALCPFGGSQVRKGFSDLRVVRHLVSELRSYGLCPIVLNNGRVDSEILSRELNGLAMVVGVGNFVDGLMCADVVAAVEGGAVHHAFARQKPFLSINVRGISGEREKWFPPRAIEVTQRCVEIGSRSFDELDEAMTGRVCQTILEIANSVV
jgi:hypothetical protein